MAVEFDWEMHRHDDKNLIVSVKDSSGAAVPLNGANEITFALSRKTDTGFNSTVLLTKQLSNGVSEVEVTDGAAGVCKIKFDSSDTDALNGEYYYEVEVIDSANDVGTVLFGTLTVTKDLVVNP